MCNFRYGWPPSLVRVAVRAIRRLSTPLGRVSRGERGVGKAVLGLLDVARYALPHVDHAYE